MIKVSIIVPVYNSSKTIDRCMNSLLNQTYKNIEIILVDDGSKDDSLKIIKKYKKNNKNVVAVHQENQGAGIARNTGIKISSGDYVTFVDSDDELEKTAIENIVSKLKKNTDIVISGFKKIDAEGHIIFKRIPSYGEWTEFKYTLTVFKLYKRDFLMSHNVLYTKDKLYEDMVFSLIAYSNTNNIVVYSNDQYIIHDNPESITSNYNSLPIYNVSNILDKLYLDINREKYKTSLLQFYFMKVIVLNVFTHIDGSSINELNKMYLNDYSWLKNKKINNIRIHWQQGESFLINLVINIFIIFTKIRLNKLLLLLIKKFKRIRLK